VGKMIILFDLDGTLIESTDAIVSTFHHSFKMHNVPLVEDEKIKQLIGYPLEIMYAELGIAENNILDFVDTYKEEYRKISTQKTELLPNALEAIELASTFAELGIVTTKTGKYSKVLLEHFNLMKYFKVLVGREDVDKPKPDAEPIIKALESFNLKGKDVYMIGDTKLDLLCAKNAKVNSIAVLCGYGKKEELQKFTKIILDDTLQAVKYLKSMKK
jgi:phosphoglycolate phosphatase